MARIATWNGAVLAESERTVFLEGNHYFPPESLNQEYFRPSRLRTLCPWKGVASYYSLEVRGRRNPHAAWTYRHPFPWIRKIRDHVAFWDGVDIKQTEEGQS